ncbi:Ion channel [Alteribacillus persepolensis]|uniref:Ion channel n=1 Tax=Alteribacillus persepolensis TaxID=568899 RepID=A0A1G8FM20_9BACI|nr:ion channel [Alteribacillus persepolensis]SDH83121.1 Ion channel [Alteribacillus persepolensis]
MKFSIQQWKAFFFLIMVFMNLAVTFAFIYIILEVTGMGHVIDHYDQHHNLSIVTFVWKSIYFSVITMAAVGYGDVTPVGYSQAVATFQSIIGYLFPIILVFILSSKDTP